MPPWGCPCSKTNPATARFCAACGAERGGEAGPVARATPPALPSRAGYLEPRESDAVCRIHKTTLDATGYCAQAHAWWVPKFRCPHCAGPLWDNGYCPTCTPRTHTFPGDYFEQRWDDGAGREYGHFVRVSKGPTPVPTPTEVAGFLGELRAIGRRIGRPIPARQPGDEPLDAEVPF